MSTLTVVPPSGPLNAKICLIGEAPGIDEVISIDKARRDLTQPQFGLSLKLAEIGPFVGQAGFKLNRFLDKAGLARSLIRFDNIWPTKLKDNDFSVLYLDKKQLDPSDVLVDAVIYLHDRLRAMPNLRVIVTLGRHPTFLLADCLGISNWRGSIVSASMIPIVKVIPTYHPAATLHQYMLAPMIIHDLIRARHESKTDAITRTKRTYMPTPTLHQVLVYLEGCIRNPSRPVTVDIETIIDTDIIHRIGFSYNRHHAISIPLYNLETCKSSWELHEEEVVLKAIAKVLMGPNPKVMQNCLFDKHWLERYRFKVNNVAWDNMIAQHVIEPGLGNVDAAGKQRAGGVPTPLSHKFQWSLYGNGDPYYKHEGKTGGRSDKENGIYNCKDCASEHQVMEEQSKHPALIRQKDVFRAEMKLLLGPLDWMMKCGTLINVDYKNKMTERFELQLELINARANAHLGREINLASAKAQVIPLLFDELKLKGVTKRTSDEEAIKIFKAKYPDIQVLDYVLQHRTRTKTLGNYWRMRIDSDNRARCAYLPTTEFGRLRSRANSLGTGTNLQNIDRRPLVRRMFVADPGMVMVAVDLEQAELRVVAHLANCWSLIEALEDEGRDVHAETTANMFGMSLEKVTKKDRDTGKRIVHLLNYGGGTDMIIKVIRIEQGLNYTRKQINYFKDRHFAKYPEIRMWQMSVEAQMNKTAKLVNCFGREHTFYQRPGPDRTRVALACIPQGTIGDLLNRIMTTVWTTFNRKGKWELLLQTHDEFIFQVPEGSEGEWIERVKPYFDVPIKVNDRDVVIPAAFKTGINWGDLEELKP